MPFSHVPPLSLTLAAKNQNRAGIKQYGNQKGKNMQPNDELSSSFDTDEDFGWVSYFLTLKGNELFCQVDDEYIQDKVSYTNTHKRQRERKSVTMKHFIPIPPTQPDWPHLLLIFQFYIYIVPNWKMTK